MRIFLICIVSFHCIGALSNTIFKSDFTKENWFQSFNYLVPAPWSEGLDRAQQIFDNTEKKKVLEVKYPKEAYDNDRTGVQWPTYLGQTFNSLTLSYRLQFRKGFDFVKGGKLPGLIGGHQKGRPHSTLTGGVKPDGTDGWSARIMWRKDGKIVQYVYHMHQPDKWGEDSPWKIEGKPARFLPGKWHNVKTRVTMNDIGKSNGCIESWLDGQKALSECAFEFRLVSGLGIDALYFSTFFGGDDATWSTKKDEYIRFGDFVIQN